MSAKKLNTYQWSTCGNLRYPNISQVRASRMGVKNQWAYQQLVYGEYV